MMTKKTPRKAVEKRSSGYLVAKFEKFPGVELPLLSEKECRARGIEPGKLPPLHTWSPEQQAALDELADVIAEVVIRDLIRSDGSDSHG